MEKVYCRFCKKIITNSGKIDVNTEYGASRIVLAINAYHHSCWMKRGAGTGVKNRVTGAVYLVLVVAMIAGLLLKLQKLSVNSIIYIFFFGLVLFLASKFVARYRYKKLFDKATVIVH